MDKKLKIGKHPDIIHQNPDIEKPVDPEEPLESEEDLDVIPEEDLFETPPEEIPPPGEGP